MAAIAKHEKSNSAQTRNFEFWTGLMEHLKAAESPLSRPRPTQNIWMNWAVGASAFHLWARLAEPMFVGVGATGPKAAEKFAWLRDNAEAISNELGDMTVVWQDGGVKQGLLKVALSSAFNPDDRASWPDLYAAIQSNLERLESVFRVWVKQVPADLP